MDGMIAPRFLCVSCESVSVQINFTKHVHDESWVCRNASMYKEVYFLVSMWQPAGIFTGRASFLFLRFPCFLACIYLVFWWLTMSLTLSESIGKAEVCYRDLCCSKHLESIYHKTESYFHSLSNAWSYLKIIAQQLIVAWINSSSWVKNNCHNEACLV